MKVILLTPGTTDLQLVEQPEPQIQNPDEIKLKVLEVGICSTDRELVTEGKACAPLGEKKLIIGHEMIGEVVEVGRSVKKFKPKDLAIVQVRRGCNHCPACLSDRGDMCYAEDYLERGIKGLHGFNAEYVIDQEKFFIKVPESIGSFGVLCEPTSIVEKGIDELITMQKSRLPDWTRSEDIAKKQALVVGLGSIGLLACMILKLRGFKVYGMDIQDSASKPVKILEKIGGIYINGRKITYKEIPDQCGPIDLIVEAAGSAQLIFQILHALGNNGACVIMGLPNHQETLSVEGGKLMEQIVLKNQLLLGSVNASQKHWHLAIEDLQKAEKKWPGVPSALITTRYPISQFKNVLTKKSAGEIKCTLVWSERT